MKRIKLIHADDHQLIRSGARALLEQEHDIEIVGEASNGPEMLTLLQQQPADVLLLDIEMPGMNGLQAATKALEIQNDLAIVLLTMYSDTHYLRSSLEVGCRGYLLKQSDTHELVAAIRDVLTEAIAAGGSSLRDHRQATGELGYFQHSFAAYGREGAACRTHGCSDTIRRIVQSGRSTFYCPTCQR